MVERYSLLPSKQCNCTHAISVLHLLHQQSSSSEYSQGSYKNHNLISQLQLAFWCPAIICRTICCNDLKSCVLVHSASVCVFDPNNKYRSLPPTASRIQNGCVLCEVRSWGLSPRRPRSMEVPDPEVRSKRGVRSDLRVWIGCSHRADLHVRST